MSVKLHPINSFNDSSIKPITDLYRVLVASRYQPAPLDEVDRYLRTPPFHASRKYDGQLWFLVCAGEDSKLVAPNGRMLTGKHPILECAKKLESGTVYAGELYRKSGSRERVGDVGSALAKQGENLAFGVFDVVIQGEHTFEFIQWSDRLTHMQTLPLEGVLHQIQVEEFGKLADVLEHFDKTIKDGAEGLVVHAGDGRISKLKPIQTTDAVIVGFTEREENGKKEVRSILLALTYEDDYIVVGSAGNFTNDINREVLYKQLQPLIVKSDYRKAASTGQVYQIVRPEFIVEIAALDVQSVDSKDVPIKQNTLHESDGALMTGPTVNAVVLLIPTAIRIRDDKVLSQKGADWSQVSSFASGAIESMDLPASTVIKRQVWTKTSADKTDVRKLVIWKTNKEEVDPNYPAYVVHWTDYSKTRKSPLDREVKPATTEKMAEEIANQLIEENIKKGWVEVTK